MGETRSQSPLPPWGRGGGETRRGPSLSPHVVVVRPSTCTYAARWHFDILPPAWLDLHLFHARSKRIDGGRRKGEGGGKHLWKKKEKEEKTSGGKKRERGGNKKASAPAAFEVREEGEKVRSYVGEERGMEQCDQKIFFQIADQRCQNRKKIANNFRKLFEIARILGQNRRSNPGFFVFYCIFITKFFSRPQNLLIFSKK